MLFARLSRPVERSSVLRLYVHTSDHLFEADLAFMRCVCLQWARWQWREFGGIVLDASRLGCRFWEVKRGAQSLGATFCPPVRSDLQLALSLFFVDRLGSNDPQKR